MRTRAEVKLSNRVVPCDRKWVTTFDWVDVALVVVPKTVSSLAIVEELRVVIERGVQGEVVALAQSTESVEPPPTSVPQENTPVVLDFTSQFAALSAEAVRLVVLAVSK